MKKILSFTAALLLSVAMMAADWTAIEFLGDGAGGGLYANKYKMSAPTASGIVNIQAPGFATEAGIYVTFPAAITDCSLTGKAIQGAGIVIYLSNFTAQETSFTVTDGANTVHNCEVFFADGTTDGEGGDPTPVDPTVDRPEAPVAAPTVPANRVIKVYSDAYDGANFSAHEGWGDATVYEEITFSENEHARLYSNLNWLGWAGGPLNVANMEKLHIDVWAENAGQLGVVPIFGGDGLTTDDSHRKILTLAAQQWNSFDLDLATDFAGLNLTSIFQFKFDNAQGAHFCIDNVYFFRTTDLVDNEAPQNFAAVAGTASYFHAVIKAVATDNLGAVTFTVKNGDNVVATKNANSGDTTLITVAGLVPATSYNLTVVASDASENATEPIAVTVSTVAAPAAAPVPAYAAADVLSIFSDAYAFAPASLNSYNEGWWDQPSLARGNIAEGDEVLYYYGRLTGMIGWQYATIDATGYTTFSIDIYPTNSGTIEIGPLGLNGRDYAETRTVVGGQWNTITIDLTDKVLNEMFQVKMISYAALGEFFIDNAFYVKPASEPEVATSYTLTFVGFDSTSGDSSTSHTQESDKADIFLTGADYVASLDTINKVYPARTTTDGVACGIKFGTSSVAGIFNITLIHPFDSVVVSAAMYGASEGGDGFTINGQTCALSAGNKVFETFTYIPTGEENTIQIQQIKAAKGRFYLNGITVYGDTALPQPEPVQQMIANPLGADGRFIVKYDCEAGAWATANPEVGETFTFAVDVTGSWLEEWLAAPAAVSGAQRGLAINKWTSRGDLNGDAVRFKQISGNIWGMTANFSQQAQGWAAAALANDSTTTVYGQLFGFEYTDASAGAAWWQWDGHDVVTTQAVGTDGLFAFAPSTGKQDAAFMTADMEGAMYGYNVAGYAEPCAHEIGYEFDHDLYNPAQAAITNTYFATGDSWTTGEASTAALDAETGDITVHIDAVKANQWQSQVFFTPGFDWEEGATYTMEFKLQTNNQLGGVTVKINNDGEGWYYSYPNDNFFLADQNTKFETGEFVAGAKGAGNGEIILAFGWVPAGTDIVISDIRISKTEEAGATLVWTKQATYTNVPASWNTADYTYPAIYTSANIQDGMKVTVEKWSDNRLVIRNWLNTTDAGYDGYTDVEIFYTPGESYPTVTAVGGNAQSEDTDGNKTDYFYSGWPNDVYYAYFYTDGRYTYIDDNEDNGYIYMGYYIYRQDASWSDYTSYYLTFEATTGVENIDAKVAQKIFENGHVFIIRDGKKYTVQGQLLK